MVKLTLSAAPEVVRRAKALAARRGTSVSALVSRLITASTEENIRVDKAKLGPVTRKLSGCIKYPPGKSDRAVLEDALLEHYNFK